MRGHDRRRSPTAIYRVRGLRRLATASSNEPLTHRARRVTKRGDDAASSTSRAPRRPAAGPMNSVVATTYSAVYLAMRHIFPDVPINAGTFEPLHHHAARGHLPRRPLSAPGLGLRRRGVAAHRRGGVRWRWRRPSPTSVTAAPAGTSGNFALGGYDPAQGRRLRHVPDLRRRLRRQRRPRRAHQRLLDHRHLQDAAGRGDGAVLSRAVPPLRAARGLGRRRRATRRLRRALRGRAAARRGARLVRHGPRPLRPAGRRSAARDGAPNVVRVHRGGETLRPGASFQGPGHRHRSPATGSRS